MVMESCFVKDGFLFVELVKRFMDGICGDVQTHLVLRDFCLMIFFIDFWRPGSRLVLTIISVESKTIEPCLIATSPVLISFEPLYWFFISSSTYGW